MFWVELTLIFVILSAILLGLATNKPRKPTFLPWLDLLSYTLTSVTVLILVLSTHTQISQNILNAVGPELDLGSARSELERYLEQDCGVARECAEAARAISTVANARGTHKDPQSVDLNAISKPELMAAAKSYNEALEQRLLSYRVMFSHAGFWIAVAVVCGMTMGIFRRALLVKDAIRIARRDATVK